jgi:hypothetical protein
VVGVLVLAWIARRLYRRRRRPASGTGA